MYEYIAEELRAAADEKYKSFHSKLIPGVEVKTQLLGVRVPMLRKMAKGIIKGDWQQFLSEYEKTTVYEEIMLYGMVMAGAKCDFDIKLGYIKAFVPKIDNWAVCDVVCGDLKDIKKHPEEMLNFIQPYLTSDKEFYVRFAVVILMQYFINERYIDTVLDIYSKINHSGYYVKMAVAWGLSVCLVKFRDKTLEFLKACKIDNFTYNKALQKARESYRISPEDKEMLKQMKR